jgi:hypothetical protein
MEPRGRSRGHGAAHYTVSPPGIGQAGAPAPGASCGLSGPFTVLLRRRRY